MAYTNLNNLYPKPARDNKNVLVPSFSLVVGAAPTAVPATTYADPRVDLVLVQPVADITVTFDGSNPTTDGFLVKAGVAEFWSLARLLAARFTAGASTTLHTSPFQL
jgi:hypothetical protein